MLEQQLLILHRTENVQALLFLRRKRGRGFGSSWQEIIQELGCSSDSRHDIIYEIQKISMEREVSYKPNIT